MIEGKKYYHWTTSHFCYTETITRLALNDCQLFLIGYYYVAFI